MARRQTRQMEGGTGEAEGFVDRVSGVVGGGADVVQDRIATLRENVTNQIRCHPFLSAGVALGTGVAAGFLARHLLDDVLDEEEKVLGMPSGLGQIVAPIGGAVLGGVAPRVARGFANRIPGRFRPRLAGGLRRSQEERAVQW